MRSVLLIAPDFPPMNRQSSRRAAAMAKYLTAWGWHVTVLTSQPEGYKHPMSAEEVRGSAGIPESQIIRKFLPDHRLVQKSRLVAKLHGLADILCLPGSASARWPGQVLPELNGRKLDPDVIWATAPHWGTFLAASALAKRLGVPWVADHRDLPDQFFADAGVRRRLAVWRERAVCRGAAHMTTVSEPMAEMLRQRHTAPVTVIPNGFDPDALCETPAAPDRGKFSIVYTGSVWGPRDPAPVSEAVGQLIAEREVRDDEMEVVFYGGSPSTPSGVRTGHPRKPPRVVAQASLSEVLHIQRQATVLLVLGHRGVRGVLTTKLFEYMAAGRPVLSYPKHPECLDKVLEATGIGVSCDSVEELKAVLRRWYQEWKQTGDIRTSRNLNEIMKYSRKEQAKALAAVLERVVAEHTGRGA